jgi:hypothetical protein
VPGKPAMVFEMQMGMIDRGAELSWISQYAYACHNRPNIVMRSAPSPPPPIPHARRLSHEPRPCDGFAPARRYPHEEECLFAPLTGIEVQSTQIEGAVLVIEARLSINLNALTIEQVVSRRRKLIIDTSTQLIKDLRFETQGAPCMRQCGDGQSKPSPPPCPAPPFRSSPPLSASRCC